MTSSELKIKIDKFSELLDGFGESTSNSKELWQLQKEIFQNFKEVDFYDREDRQNNWKRFQGLADTLRKKQDDINSQNEKFADEADRLIDKFKDSIGGGLFSKQFEKADFVELRNLSFEIFEFIKQPCFPSKERRVAVWDKFNILREELREKENEYYTEIRKKITKRNEHSGELTEKIINTIDACHPDTPLEDLFELLGKLVLYLTGIGFLMDAVEWLLGIKDDKPKNPLKVKSEALKDVRKFITENRDDITREDKQKIYARLDVVQADLNKAWDDYKVELNERKKIKEEKQINWEKNQREYLGKLEVRLEKQIAFKEKQENRLENQKEFLEKQEKRLENQQDFLRKLNEQLDDLEDKYSNAWNDNFKDKVSDWIDDKKSKISDVEDELEKIEDKIEDVKKDIKEIEDKIDEVEKSILEIQTKIDEIRGKL